MKYTAKRITPLGDHDPKYGTRYWGSVHDSDMPVSFNLMNPVDINDGATLEFEEKVVKESKKGTEYFFLRKVKVEGNAIQTSMAAPADLTSVHEQLDKILKLLGDDGTSGETGYQKFKAKAKELPRSEPEPDNVDEDLEGMPEDWLK